MKRRDKWIIIVLIGCLACWIAYVGYSAIWIMCDLKSMESRRPVLLYETDHRELLEACREISRQVALGKLEPGMYGRRDPKSRQFPQLILDLDPLRVDVEKDGQVDIIMSPVVMYGVSAFPEDYEGSRSGVGGIELIEGLWYYDEDFPEASRAHEGGRGIVEEKKGSGFVRRAIGTHLSQRSACRLESARRS